jgi:arylsulfatase A-like enzyme
MRPTGLSYAVLLVAGSLSLEPAPLTPVAQASPPRPNIILVLTDDLDTRIFSRMPGREDLLTGEGTTFTNSFVSLSLCCPSRTALLRGQYAHNTGIFTNNAPAGGFQAVHDRGLEASTAATWLHAAGYRTILLGKYLNGYPGAAGQTYIPPGWSEWHSPVGGVRYFDYDLNDNGRVNHYGDDPRDYLTDVLSRKSNAFIRRMAGNGGGQPFFMYIAPYAPHGPATPAPRHASAFPNAQAPRTASFDEEDVSDKPAWVQSHPRLTASQIDQMDNLYRKRRQSMLAVEDLLEGLIETLEDTGQLDNTYIFFTSDNGFHQGQHRLTSGKNTGFEEDLRVPLVVRGPGVPEGAIRGHLVANIDLAPTFAALAGVAAPGFVDGRSLVPLLGTSPPPQSTWRRALLLEHGLPDDPERPGIEGSALIEPSDPDRDDLDPTPIPLGQDPAGAVQAAPVFQGLRTANRLSYIEYANGERELYDLALDPDQLANGHEGADPVLVARLAAWVALLRDCAGATCRTGESGPP